MDNLLLLSISHCPLAMSSVDYCPSAMTSVDTDSGFRRELGLLDAVVVVVGGIVGVGIFANPSNVARAGTVPREYPTRP